MQAEAVTNEVHKFTKLQPSLVNYKTDLGLIVTENGADQLHLTWEC